MKQLWHRELNKLSEVTHLESNRRMTSILQPGSRLMLLIVVVLLIHSTVAQPAQWLGELGMSVYWGKPDITQKQANSIPIKKNEIKFELVKWIPSFHDTKFRGLYFCLLHIYKNLSLAVAITFYEYILESLLIYVYNQIIAITLGSTPLIF